MTRRRRAAGVLGFALGVLGVAVSGPAQGQLLDPSGSTTTSEASTTTAPPETAPPTSQPPASSTTTTEPGLLGGGSAPVSSTTTTAPPDDEDPGSFAPGGESTPAPEGAGSDTGDGAPDGTAEVTWGYVPAEAQRIIDSVPRTPANGSAALFDAVQELVELGLSPDEAIRVGFGRFPVAGVAKYSHDWLFPRYGPGFRFHLGTDVFAPYGTPLRAPVDGIARSSVSTLGGLSVKVYMDDGTYFYMAHLSALPDGFVDGMSVRTGDIVGFIGDSGNAKGGSPHLHFGIFPRGGAAVDPKPVLDQFLADAVEALPQVIEQVRADRAGAESTDVASRRIPRALFATALLRPVIDERAAGGAATAMLFGAVGNPPSGGLAVAAEHAQQIAAGIDWEARAVEARISRRIVEETTAIVRLALGPLAPL